MNLKDVRVFLNDRRYKYKQGLEMAYLAEK
jgi:hypothetical protein